MASLTKITETVRANKRNKMADKRNKRARVDSKRKLELNATLDRMLAENSEKKS